LESGIGSTDKYVFPYTPHLHLDNLSHACSGNTVTR